MIEAGSVVFFVRELLQAEHQVPPPPGVTIRQAGVSDKDALLYGVESSKSWEMLQARFEAGDLCFAALDDQGRAVHTRWVTSSRAYIPELGMEFVAAPDAAYSYDAYTRPDSRRRGIDGAVRRAVFAAAKALGRSRVYSYARGDNPAGLRAAGRLQQAVGTVNHVRLFASKPIAFGSGRAAVSELLRPRRR